MKNHNKNANNVGLIPRFRFNHAVLEFDNNMLSFTY